MSALFFDADHFKSVNDRFGHPVGDAVLSHVARAVRTALREHDACVRYGGEEILVVLEDADEREAAAVAERIRASVETQDWPRVHEGLAVTISAGVAERSGGETVESWLARADAALYQAKHAGRNRVRLASDVPAALARPALPATLPGFR